MTPTTPGSATPAARRRLVTVVVPVYNPGPEIEPCLASLQAQSLPRARFDVIFVDDGSTDGTPDRLERLAAASSNMRVIRIAASGAPGRPRNTGLEAADSRYVLFLDADDALAPTALERLAAWGDRYGSDIVIGKYASASRPRRQAMFGSNIPRTTLRSTPSLIDSSLGATKLFRLGLLREAGIRFPEGWRLMEDQYFVLRAYVRASAISLLADRTYAYFRRREDGEHLSERPLDLDADVPHLRELLDMVEAETSPGPLRERATRRLYRAEILGRLTGEAYLGFDSSYRHELFEQARAFAVDRVDPALDAGLNAIARFRSTLLRAGREDALLELARRLADVELQATVRRATWRHGQLQLRFRAHLSNRSSGNPVGVVDHQGAPHLDPALTAGIADHGVAVADALAGLHGNVHLRNGATAEEWVVPTRLSLAFRSRSNGAGRTARWPVVDGVAHLDPLKVGPGPVPLESGTWEVNVRLNLLGIDERASLRLADTAHPEPALLGDPPILIDVRADGDAGLRLVASHLGAEGARAGDRRPPTRLVADLPVASDVGVRPLRAEVIALRADGSEAWPAIASHRFGRLVVHASPRPTGAGRVSLHVRLVGHDRQFPIGEATVADGQLRMDAESLPAAASKRPLRWLTTRLADAGRRRYVRLVGLAMPLGRRLLEGAPRSLRAPLLKLTRTLRR
jgi:hypothetical protein